MFAFSEKPVGASAGGLALVAGAAEELPGPIVHECVKQEQDLVGS